MQRTLRIWLLFLALVSATLLPQTVSSADFSAIWNGANANWDDPLQWSGCPNGCYPDNTASMTFDATINSGTVALDRDITIQRLFFNGNINGGEITGSSQLTLNEGFTWNGGEIALGAGGAINLPVGSTSSVTSSLGSNQEFTSGTINNAGSFTMAPTSAFFGTNGIINNLAGASWTMQNGSLLGDFGVFNNAGNFIVQKAVNGNAPFIDSVFNNSGTVTLQSTNGFLFSLYRGGSASGTFNIPTGFDLRLSTISNAVHPYTFTAGALVTGGGTMTVTDTGSLDVAGDSTINTSFFNGGLLTVESGATLSLNGPITQAGTIRLNGGTITTLQTLRLVISPLSGSGTINGNVSDSNAPISPGASAGIITINGQLSLLNNAKLVMEIGGLTQGTEYDYLAVSGMVGLGGTLELQMLNGFQLKLDPSQTFTLLTSNSLLDGFFNNIANGARLTTSDGLASFQVNYGIGSKYGANNLVLSDPQIVPEPASLVFFASGAVVLGIFRFRRR